MLGEDNAAYLGVAPEKQIFRLIVINAIMVSVATAMVSKRKRSTAAPLRPAIGDFASETISLGPSEGA